MLHAVLAITAQEVHMSNTYAPQAIAVVLQNQLLVRLELSIANINSQQLHPATHARMDFIVHLVLLSQFNSQLGIYVNNL